MNTDLHTVVYCPVLYCHVLFLTTSSEIYFNTVILLQSTISGDAVQDMNIFLFCLMFFVCFLPIHSGLQWTYQPGPHRKKVTQDFPSTFFLRCLPEFFSREGFSRSFPSSTVKSNFVY